MTIYAVIDKTEVVDGVEKPKGFVVGYKENNIPNPMPSWVNIENLTVVPQVGWEYDGTNFISPPVPIKNKLLLSLPMFIDQFTEDEYELYLDIDSYDKKETKTEKVKAVKVKRGRNKLARKKGYPKAEFMQISQVFVTEGILTQARYDEIIEAITGIGVEEGLLDGLPVV